MFARRLIGGAASPFVAGGRILGQDGASVGGNQMQQARNVASMKVLAARMRSVKNMQKITKAMKMVAAAKLKHDQRRMEIGMPFMAPVQALMERLPRTEKAGPMTIFGITSDKGLCGGINNGVAKLTRNTLVDEEAKGNPAKVMMIGNKGTAALKRLYGDRFTVTFEEVVKSPWCFATASMIAERVIQAKPSRFCFISNKFISMAAYDTRVQQTVTVDDATTMDKSDWSKAMDVYSFEPSIYEVWDDLHEWYIGSILYGAYLEGATSEQSARMSAMENASKNAGEMLDKLSLIYNRARQAKITTELCEIISGASAV